MKNRSYAICLTLLVVLMVSGSYRIPARSSAEQSAISHMSIGEAIILGIVEGVTEYLPVSSTGHLLLTQHIFEIQKAGLDAEVSRDQKKVASDAYAICIQFGAILAVIGLYLRRMKQMVQGIQGKNPIGLKLALNIGIAFLPAAVVGLLLNDYIKTYLFGIEPVVIAWFAGGILILYVANRQKATPADQLTQTVDLEQLTWKMSLIIGFAQTIAMWPGVSRSLVTIIGGVFIGLSLTSAVEFSFLLGMVTLSAATMYDFLQHGHVMLHYFDLLSILTGIGVAFLAAFVSVKWMVAFIQKFGLAFFGYYRIALSVVVAGLILGDLI